MWMVASTVLLVTCLLSNGRGFEVNKTRSERLSYQNTPDDFFKDEGSGERGNGITEIFSFNSQSPSDDVVENPVSLFISPQGGNDQEIPLTSEQDQIVAPSPTEQPDSQIKTQASRSGITDIREVEFRDSPETQSRSTVDLPKTRREPHHGAHLPTDRLIHSPQPFLNISGKLSSGHKSPLSKIQEEMKTPPDDVNSDTEVSEDYDYDMDNDNDIDSIYTLAHFRHELYAYVEERVVAANRSMVELQLHLQQKISQLEYQLVENMAYTSVLETKIRVSATPLPGDLRLLSSENSGRMSRAGYLLYYTGTTWGFVCDDFFNAAAVKVACTQLGYPEPPSGFESGIRMSASELDRQLKRRWEESYQIVLDDVQCTGEESAIDSCSHFEQGKHDCSMDEVVYLSC